MRGTVLWWTSEKGYGKIKGDDEKYYFVHYSCVRRDGSGKVNLEKDEIVEFDPCESPRGLRAENVKTQV